MSPSTRFYNRFFYWKWMQDTQKPLLLWYVQANGGDVRYEERDGLDEKTYHVFTDAEDHIEYGLQGELLALVNRIHGFPLSFRLALKEILCPEIQIGLLEDKNNILRENIVKETRILYPLTERSVRFFVQYIDDCWKNKREPSIDEFVKEINFPHTYFLGLMNWKKPLKEADFDKDCFVVQVFVGEN